MKNKKLINGDKLLVKWEEKKMYAEEKRLKSKIYLKFKKKTAYQKALENKSPEQILVDKKIKIMLRKAYIKPSI